LIAEGKEIINMPSGDQMFGNNAPAYQVGNVEAPVYTMPQGNAPVNNQGGMPGGQQFNNAPNQNQQFNNNGGMSNQGQAPDQHFDVLPNQFQNNGQQNQQFNNNNGMPGMPGMNR
jgi:hypothetical protein